MDTLKYIRHETNAWLEITTLLIPDKNDSDEEIQSMSAWILDHLGDRVPLHFTAFHPDWKMTDTPRTPGSTLLRARDIARKEGIRYVYVGNIHDEKASSTYCPGCSHLLIARDWHRILEWNLDYRGACLRCGTTLDGVLQGPPGVSTGRPYRINIEAPI